MAAPALAELRPRDKIIDAAEALFARRGYTGVGMRELAEAAGLGKSSLFHHFRTKEELYLAVVLRMLDSFDQRLSAALAAGGGPLERFDRWIDTVLDLLAEEPNASRLLLRSLFEDDDFAGDSDAEQRADEVLGRILQNFAALLREGMQAGVFRAASIPHTVQSVIGLTVYHFASGDLGAEIVGRSIFDPAEVKRRKSEVKALLRGGLVADRNA